MRTFAKRAWAGLTPLVLTAAVGLVAPTGAQARSSCGVHWGSLPKAGTTASSPGPIYDVRGGRHACFDALVIDVGARIGGGYDVRYVDEVPDVESGPVRGGAVLQVLVRTGISDRHSASLAYRPADSRELVDVRGWQTFRQVALGSTSEETSVGLGVRARLPFRVFVLPGPGPDNQRLVVHVAHRW